MSAIGLIDFGPVGLPRSGQEPSSRLERLAEEPRPWVVVNDRRTRSR